MIIAIWYIYDAPKNPRGRYVARKFVGGKPTDLAVAHNELDRLRKLLIGAGYTYCVARRPTDDPVIVEAWL
jgi:hypothetical protein